MLVSRIACADGVTGRVQEPVVTYQTDRIVIQVDVEPLRPSEASCPGSEQVPVRVDLSEPVGEREIVDGTCLERRDLVDCQRPARWSPSGRS